jgi:hypothetical protein
MKVVAMIGEAFISPNERDRNGDDANVVDGLFAIARSIRYLAEVLENRKPEQTEKPTYRPGDFR